MNFLKFKHGFRDEKNTKMSELQSLTHKKIWLPYGLSLSKKEFDTIIEKQMEACNDVSPESYRRRSNALKQLIFVITPAHERDFLIYQLLKEFCYENPVARNDSDMAPDKTELIKDINKIMK